MAAIVNATPKDFYEFTSNGRVLIDVWGRQCRPCLALMPHVERLAEERDDLTVVKLEAPTARRLCIDLRVMKLPTFLLFENGEEVSRLTDPGLAAEQLRQWLDDVVGAEGGDEGGFSSP